MMYVNDGQVVWAPTKPGFWVRCVVAAAMGDTARVVNERRGVDTWFHIGELLAQKPNGLPA